MANTWPSESQRPFQSSVSLLVLLRVLQNLPPSTVFKWRKGTSSPMFVEKTSTFPLKCIEMLRFRALRHGLTFSMTTFANWSKGKWFAWS